MKAVGLRVDGFKKLSAVEMSFASDGLTFIKGDNGQGKSSIIDVIYYLFKGKSVTNEKVIQNGKDKMTAEIELDEYTIKRTKTDKSDTLKIVTKDGLEVRQTPQAFLDKLVNDLTFSPFVFLNKNAKEKFEFLAKFLGIDTSEIDKKIAEKSSERTTKGRIIKELGIPQPYPEVKEVNTKELMKKYQNLLDKKHAIEEKNAERDRLNSRKENIKIQIANLQKELVSIEDKLKEKVEEVPDLTKIKEEIANAQETNSNASKYTGYLAKKEKYDKVNNEYNTLNEEIEELRKQRKEIFISAKTGIEGLSLTEDGVYYKGIYSENWSDSEAISISASLCLSMQPDLKAVFIDRGESFGKRRMEELEKWAKENGIQVIITKVEDSIPQTEDIPANVWYLEEGRIVNQPGQQDKELDI